MSHSNRCMSRLIDPPSNPYIDYRLSVQVGKQYPYVAPTIEMKEIKGLSKEEQAELAKQLGDRAKVLSESGSVMMIELVQVAEDFLLEHNRDPNMSAWEQMKAREALEKEQETKVRTESEDKLARIINNSQRGTGYRILSPLSSTTKLVGGQVPGSGGAVSTEIEREMLRQRDALEAARRVRMGEVELQRNSSLLPDDEAGSDYEEFDYEADYEAALGLSGVSRYQSDFIEFGVLGRGGGGEVVKVRNRLDRRTYAIKKIILEPERGKYGAIQNQKLRREVTTISRMTHKNIVRYYQAWVEGGIETIEEAVVLDEENEEASSSDSGALLDVEDGSDDSDGDSTGGWWTSSPSENVLPSEMRQKIKTSTEKRLGADNKERPGVDDRVLLDSFDDEDEDIDMSKPFGSKAAGRDLHSDSMLNLLEQENDHGFHSPLLTGLGFPDQTYRGLFDKKGPSAKDSSSESGEDLPWDESSVKVDSTSQSKSILYIQMEYCSTTLRFVLSATGCLNG